MPLRATGAGLSSIPSGSVPEQPHDLTKSYGSPFGLGMPRAVGPLAAGSPAGSMGYFLTGERPRSVPVARHMLQEQEAALLADTAVAAAAAAAAGEHEFYDQSGR